MGELFENFKGFDLPAAREKAKAEGWAEGHAEGEKLFPSKFSLNLLKGRGTCRRRETFADKNGL